MLPARFASPRACPLTPFLSARPPPPPPRSCDRVSFIRDKRPGIYEDPSKPGTQTGLLSFGWKASRVGERLSPWVSAACMAMAFHTLFIK